MKGVDSLWAAGEGLVKAEESVFRGRWWSAGQGEK